MGSGSSKSNKLEVVSPDVGGHNQQRRHSHIDTNPPPLSNVLVECPICKRSFAEDRIERHKEVSFKSDFFLSIIDAFSISAAGH